jgi:hypothetical protein
MRPGKAAFTRTGSPMNIASPVPAEKRSSATPRIFDPELSGQLPCWLDELSPLARARAGRALDDGAIKLLLDRDGRVLVARGGRS